MPDPSPSPQQPPPSGAEPRYYTMPERFLAITRGKAAAPSAPRPSLPSAAPPVAANFPPSVDPPKADSSPSDGGAPTPKLQQPAPGAGKRRMLLVWGSVGAVVVIGGALAAWWVLRTIPTQVASRESRVESPQQAVESRDLMAGQGSSDLTTPDSQLTTPPPPPALPVEPEAQAQPPVVDGDGDGLTSDEEQIFGTDDANEDTDGDSYSDRAEILNLYHPGSTEPARLLDAGLVFGYRPADGGWSVYVPRGMEVLEKACPPPCESASLGRVEDGASMHTITLGTGAEEETVVLTEVSYSPALGLVEWANQRPDGRALPPLLDVSSARGATGVRRAGEPVYFALAPGRALRIEHRFSGDVPRYATVYEMVVNSVAVDH